MSEFGAVVWKMKMRMKIGMENENENENWYGKCRGEEIGMK